MQFFFRVLILFHTLINSNFIIKQSSQPPVILVPGFLGSTLEATVNKYFVPYSFCKKVDLEPYIIWPQPQLLAPGLKKCVIHNLELHDTAQSPVNTLGVRIWPYAMYSTDGISWLSVVPKTIIRYPYLRNLVTALTAIGYVDEQNLIGMPYDFRQSPGK